MEKVKVEEIEKEEMEEKAEEKPYKFRALSFKDIFPMTNLINKIGINKFTSLLSDESIMNLIQGKKPMKIDEGGNEIVDETEHMKQLASAMITIVNIILESLDSCENELYKVLSSASNLSVEEISTLPIKYVPSMITDFIKKDDFMDFFTELLSSLGMK